MNVNGYEMKTTFWQDFHIADHFGERAIRDTFKRAFEEWKSNVEYLTELVMVLNWKLWQHYDRGNERFAKVYDELWRKADHYAVKNLKGKDLTYFLEVTD